jgi:hypothetical protein
VEVRDYTFDRDGGRYLTGACESVSEVLKLLILHPRLKTLKTRTSLFFTSNPHHFRRSSIVNLRALISIKFHTPFTNNKTKHT